MIFGYGEQIRKYRKFKNMTMKDLAIKLGVTEQAISQYERNIRTPNRETIIKISEILEIDINSLSPQSNSISWNSIAKLISSIMNDFIKNDESITAEQVKGLTSYEFNDILMLLSSKVGNIIEDRKLHGFPENEYIFSDISNVEPKHIDLKFRSLDNKTTEYLVSTCSEKELAMLKFLDKSDFNLSQLTDNDIYKLRYLLAKSAEDYCSKNVYK